jgi:SAM-dependent methyltransferase
MAPSHIELVVPIIGVGLQDAGVSGQMRLGMLALAVARVVEHRRRRTRSPKRPIVPDVNPASPRVGLSLGQHRHGRIISMKPLGHHDIGFDQAKQRIKRRADRSHGICHSRQRNRHTFESITVCLAVQGLMLAELLEHDHGQQARTGPSSCDRMEWRWRLANLLTVAARELLPNRLDHFPLARHHFQRPGHVFAEFAQPIAAAAFASCRRINHHLLAWQMLGECLALGALARKSAHRCRLGHSLFGRKFVFSGIGFQLFGVYSLLVLHFVSDPHQALREMRRVLRPGGTAAATVWDNYGGMPSIRADALRSPE